jgi:hypothetical protein
VDEGRDDGYELSGNRARIDFARVHRRLSTDTYRVAGRPLEQMPAALDRSEPFGFYRGAGAVPACHPDAYAVYARHGFTEVQAGRRAECDPRS